MHVRSAGALVVLAALCSWALAGPGEGESSPAPTSAPPEATTTPAPTSVVSPPPDHGAAPAAKFSWEPFGYLRLQYLVVQNDPNVQFVGRDDGFELQNARFGVRGKLGDKMRFVMAIDGAVDERAQINTPEGKLKVGMRDAYVDVVLTGQVFARAGFFETLVDPNLEGDNAREFVDKPIESRGMRATEGYQTEGLTPGRSLGAAVRMESEGTVTAPAFGFELAVQNGADEYASNNDNDTPAVSASALVKLPNDGWVVASGRFNRRTVGSLPFRQDEDDLQGTFGARFVAGPVAIGGAAAFTRTMFPTTGGPAQNAYGAHAQLAVRIDGKNPIAIGYRFGILDPSSLLLTDRVMEHTAGAVMAVPAYRMRVQLQATHVVEQAARTLSNDRIQLAAEVSL
ncbi:MAG: hypothetical protein H0T46_32565 [Deltaproteobacteria bacterium]|nr:hypothetical protein [Deltaproteobacteria bacterium]